MHYASYKKAILSLCNNRDGYSIAELSRLLEASIPKVSRIVTEMVSEGTIVEKGKMRSEGGRRAAVYGLNPDAGCFLGVEVGHEGLIIAVTDFPGQIIQVIDDIPFTLTNTEESVSALCKTVMHAVDRHGVDRSRVKAYGISLTGRVNQCTGYSYSYFISEEKPIRKLLEEGFGSPVIVENDSRAMAFGEYIAGAGGDEETSLFLNLGWGLGMGMIVGGKLFYGKSGFSGEIGHFPFFNNNLYCRCGKTGCLETAASGLALHRLVEEQLDAGRQSVLTPEHKEGREITLDDILSAVRKEDIVAIECIEEVGSTLGRAVAGLINIFNPELVVIGGRLSVAEHYLMPPLRSAVNKYSLNLVNKDTLIKASVLGKRAGAIGASLLAKDFILSEMQY